MNTAPPLPLKFGYTYASIPEGYNYTWLSIVILTALSLAEVVVTTLGALCHVATGVF